MSGITSFQCHNKGHFQDKCPLAKKECARSVIEENPGTGSELFTNWRYKRSENGEPYTKVVIILLILFAKNVYGETQVGVGIPQMITIQNRR